MRQRQANKQEILAALTQKGEDFILPNGEALELNYPNVSDLTRFMKQSKELEGSDDMEATAMVPIEMLQSVTKGYNFTPEQAMDILSLCGGVQGDLGKKVYSLYGINLEDAIKQAKKNKSATPPKVDNESPTASQSLQEKR